MTVHERAKRAGPCPMCFRPRLLRFHPLIGNVGTLHLPLSVLWLIS